MTHSPEATEYKTDKFDYINIEIVFVTKSTINTVKRLYDQLIHTV